MSKNNLLEVDNLNKKFYTKSGTVNAIDNVSFVVPEGKVVGLIGESGSGKTTIGRTIMNLHQADSGLIKFKGKEIGGKHLNKAQKRDLYWNIQMIFQDPYSSLNTQKNIYSILKESLTAKKLDRQMLKNFLKNKDKVLTYFALTIKKHYWENFYEYRREANKKALAILSEIESELGKIQVDPSINMSLSWQKLKAETFERRQVMDYFVLSLSDDLVKSLYDMWAKAQIDYEKGDFAFPDEIALKKAEQEYEEFEKSLEKSALQLKLEKTAKELSDKLKELNSEKALLVKQTKSNIKKTKFNLRKLRRDYFDEALLTSDLSKRRRFLFLADREKYLLRMLFKSVKIAKNQINGTLSADIETCRVKLDEFYRPQVEDTKSLARIKLNDPQTTNDILDYLVDSHKSETDAFDSEFQKLTAQLTEVRKQIIAESLKPIVVDQVQAQKVKDDYAKARADFESELAKARESFAKQLDDLIKDNEAKNNELTAQIETTIKNIEGRTKQVLLEITKKCAKSSQFKNRRQEVKAVKADYKKSVSEAKGLFNELKRNFAEIELIKTTLGFGKRKFNIQKSFIGRKLLTNALIKQKVFETLEDVGLNRSHAFRYPHEFSGGMRQRVGIARAIISEPKLIIADEPIAALDLSIQAQIVNLLLELKNERNLSMIFIAHDLSMVEYNSDYVLIMHQGKVVEYGETVQVFAKPLHPYTINLMSAMPNLSKISERVSDRRFEAKYREGYGELAVPTYHQISSEHFIYGTEEQIKEWTKKKAPKH